MWSDIGRKIPEAHKLGVKFYAGKNSNFHENFVDLNPSWARDRHKKAVITAKKILEQITKNLKEDVEKRKFEIFKQKVQNGMRLDATAIGNLKPKYRDEYKAIIK